MWKGQAGCTECQEMRRQCVWGGGVGKKEVAAARLRLPAAGCFDAAFLLAFLRKPHHRSTRHTPLPCWC